MNKKRRVGKDQRESYQDSFNSTAAKNAKKKFDIPLRRPISTDWVVISPEEKKEALGSDGSSKDLKRACRAGIPPQQRKIIWLTVTDTDHIIENDPDLYKRHIRELFPKAKVFSWRDIPQIPTFGSVCDWKPYNLSDGDIDHIQEMLCVLGHNYPSLRYCPLLVEVIPILLSVMSPSETYAVCTQLLLRSQREGWYFQLTTVRTAVFTQTFVHLLEDKAPKLISHMERLNFDFVSIINDWFNRLFVGYLPPEVVFRISDAFFCEGYKVLYRVALAIFTLFTRTGLECIDAEFLTSSLRNWCKDPNPDLIMDTGFRFFLKRKSFHTIDGHHDVSRLDIPQAETRVLRWPPFEDNSSFIVNTQQIYQLWCWLPEKERTGDLCRLYSSHEDGRSMNTMLEKAEQKGPTILLISDSEGGIFGAFLHNPIVRSLKPQIDRSLILFSILPQPHFYVWNQNEETDVVTYFGTDKLYIGDLASHAIYLPGDMAVGTTSKTGGFQSPPLSTALIGDFECKEIEVWGFKDALGDVN